MRSLLISSRTGNAPGSSLTAFRLATRYEPDFTRTVLEQFDVAFEERGVLALLADGWREQPPLSETQTLSEPIAFGPLSLVGLETDQLAAGKPLPVTLLWQSTQAVDSQLNTSVQLVAEDGSRVAQADGPPANGIIPPSLIFDQPVPDFKTLDLPADLAPGRYRLEVSVYDLPLAGGGEVRPLTDPQPVAWFDSGPPVTLPKQPINAVWDEPIELVGMDSLSETLQAGDELSVRLVWRTTGDVNADYTAFLHLVDADGTPVAQQDQPPGGAFYPTSAWQSGDLVEDVYRLTVPEDAAAGPYRLIVGLYRPDSGERLTGENGDTVELRRSTIE